MHGAYYGVGFDGVECTIMYKWCRKMDCFEGENVLGDYSVSLHNNILQTVFCWC